MRRRELNERSPVRLLESSLHGGVGEGNIAVVVARHGVGKTAFLVGVALDDLMRGRNVLHVSVDQTADRVRTFYDEVFNDLAHESKLEDVWKVRVDLERHRRISCYLDGTFSVEKLTTAIEFMGEHTDFVPTTIVLDGFPIEETTEAEMQSLREIIGKLGAEMWMTAVRHRDDGAETDGTIPPSVAKVIDQVDVVLQMAHDTKAVHVSLLKDHDNENISDLKVALDPRTMLLMRES